MKIVKRTFYDALSDLNTLINKIASGKSIEAKIEKPEEFAAVNTDQDDTWYEVIGKVITDLEEHYEADKVSWQDTVDTLKEEVKTKETELEEEKEKAQPTVSVSLCEDGDYRGMSLGIHADNLRDQWKIDEFMSQLNKKHFIQEAILDYKIMH